MPEVILFNNNRDLHEAIKKVEMPKDQSPFDPMAPFAAGAFLPQIAVDPLWAKEPGQCMCLDGLAASAWRMDKAQRDQKEAEERAAKEAEEAETPQSLKEREG